MAEQLSSTEQCFEVDRLGWRAVLVEVITAIATTIGLLLLWGLEGLRNAFFNLLDRMNIRPRPRKGSAFPPGLPRKLTQS